MSMLEDLHESTDPRFKHLLGKKIRFIHKDRPHYGVLRFAGINQLLHNEFQVTAGRTPYWPVDPNTIQEVVGRIN